VLIVISALLFKQQSENKSKFFPKRPLTEPEQIFYWKLRKALPEHVVLAQVSFSRFLYTKGATAKNNFWRFAQGRQKVADFVICDKSFYIVAIVELDDSSHSTDKDKIRDTILKEAGLHIIRWNVKNMPSDEDIRRGMLATTRA